MATKQLTKKELEAKLQALGEITEEQKKSIVCSLIGHSDIVDSCFGQVTCGRCGDMLGDTLMGTYSRVEQQVVINHDCDTCRTNWDKLTWKDRYLVDYSLEKPTS